MEVRRPEGQHEITAQVATDDLRAQRRARREERRAKQRITNVLRAKKMHAARLEFERNADPIEPPSELKPKVHVGCSGWFYWHWRDQFYPPGTPTSKWFEHYTSQFDTVELNAPFY